MLEVSDVADRLPSDLSTGTKRSVAIARALAEDPDAILYDEPTTMVDPVMAAHTTALIVKLKQTLHKTSIVVTHDTHLAEEACRPGHFSARLPRVFFGTWAGNLKTLWSPLLQKLHASKMLSDSCAGRHRVRLLQPP